MNAEQIKNLKSFILRFGLSGGLLWWLFTKIDVSEMVDVVKSADVKYILASLGVFFLANVVILYRWYVFVKAMNLVVKFSSVVIYFFIGLFCNLFLPSAIGGDVIKGIGLCREVNEKPKVFASILLDRLSGFAGIVVVAIIVFPFGQKIVNDPAILISIAGLACLSLGVVAVLFNERVYSMCIIMFKAFPKVEKSLMQMHYDIALMKGNKRQGLFAIVLSAFTQVLLALIFFLLAKAMHQEVNFVYFLIFSPLVCVATALPSIGGLGVREVGWVYFLSKVGVAEGVAASMSLLSFGFMIVVGLLGGLIYVVTLSPGRVQRNQTH